MSSPPQSDVSPVRIVYQEETWREPVEIEVKPGCGYSVIKNQEAVTIAPTFASQHPEGTLLLGPDTKVSAYGTINGVQKTWKPDLQTYRTRIGRRPDGSVYFTGDYKYDPSPAEDVLNEDETETGSQATLVK